MKISITRKAKQQAGTLLVVLVTCTIFAITIMGYLSVIEHQNYLCARTQSWDSAMTVVEAGIEEGLQHLNSSSNNLGNDSWQQSGNFFTMTRTLANGNSYTVTIDNTVSANPSIVSRASVAPPGGLLSLNQPSVFFATGGQDINVQPSVINRAVRVRTARGLLFTAAMVARKSIDLKGNGIMTDSFDSSQPGFKSDTNGHYNASIYAGDKGDIASNGGIEDSVSVANANIYGKVHTGPNQPVSVGPNGGVGTHAWQDSNNGFQDGYVLQDANFTFPDTSLPSTSDAVPPMDGTNGGVYYKYYLEPGRKYFHNGSLSGKIYVAGPDVTLVLPTGLNISDDLKFAPDANLEIYAGGTSVAINGNEVINPNGYAGSLIVYCAPSVTSFTLNGNGEFTGVLVAPNVDIDMNGGGHSNNDFIGALMVKSVKMNGHFSFHFDEALLNGPKNGRYLITSWDEIDPN